MALPGRRARQEFRAGRLVAIAVGLIASVMGQQVLAQARPTSGAAVADCARSTAWSTTS